MPLLLLGIEKLLTGQRPYVLIAAVCLSACSNFYFFYMQVLLSVVYVIVRLACAMGKKRMSGRTAAICLGKIAGASGLGVLLGGALLFPVIHSFLSSPRATAAAADAGMWFYPLSYYSKFVSLLVGGRQGAYWLRMGIPSIASLACFLLLRKKGYPELKICMLLCLCFALFPVFGKILNGFSYVSNRWSWAIALCFSAALAFMWPHMLTIDRKDAAYLTICGAGFLAACMLLEYSRQQESFFALALMLVGVLTLVVWPWEEGKKGALRREQILIVFLVAVNILTNSFWLNAPMGGGEDYASEAITRRQASSELNNNETAAVREATKGDDSFFRYSGALTSNASFSAGLKSTQFYWTISSPAIADYRQQMQELAYSLFMFSGHDDRAVLNAFSGVKYHVQSAQSGAAAPYGYVKLGDYSDGRYAVYETENALPLGYTYEKAMGDELWNSLSGAEKQQAMLQAVYLEDGQGAASKNELTFDGAAVPFTVSPKGKEVTWQEDCFVVTKANAEATLEFTGSSGCETYLILSGIHFASTPEYDLYFGGDDVDPQGLYNEESWEKLEINKKLKLLRSRLFWSEEDSCILQTTASSGVSKGVELNNANYQFYNGRRDFIVNYGYSDEALTAITLKFPARGIYSFDKLEVFCQPMGTFPEQIAQLREDTLENVDIGVDQVSGTISLDKPKILCLSIPYSTGWSAYVDGQETELERANLAYMALPLEAGEHQIVLRYETPFMKLGCCASAVGVVCLAVCVICTERKKRAAARPA